MEAAKAELTEREGAAAECELAPAGEQAMHLEKDE